MRQVLIPLCLLILPLGCAAERAAENEPRTYPAAFKNDDFRDYNRFVVYSAGSEIVGARVDKGGVLGFNVNLGRYTDPGDHALRGFVYGSLINARVAQDGVHGLAASLPLEIEVKPVEDAVRARGLVYGRDVDLLVGPRVVGGKLGRCSFNLVRQGPVYAGRRRCNGRDDPEFVELSIPRGFRTWSPVERATALSLLLFLD